MRPMPRLINAAGAWEWVNLVVEAALEGDADAIAVLPAVVAHALELQRAELAA
jgi:hypothetical protein